MELVDGGGARADIHAVCEIEPATISISGSEEALKSVTEISLTSINLGDVDTTKGMEVSVEIKLPDNLKNRSGVTEAKVTVTLRGLMTKTLTLTRDQIEKIQVPEGMRADILTQMLDVTFRGPASQLETLTARGCDRHGRLYRGESRDLYAAPVLHHQRYRPGWGVWQ